MSNMQLSEESKERIGKIIDFSRVAIHYGYLPLIVYLAGFTYSEPRPSLIRHVRLLMAEKKHGRFSPATVEAIGGLSAGTISTLIVHPLDVIKTRLQIARGASTSRKTSGFTILRGLLRNQKPVQSLYRGLSPNLVGNASSWAIFFYFKSLIESQLSSLHGSSRSSQHGLMPSDYFLAAGLAGIATTLSTAPIWVLKTRMLSSERESRGAYQNMWQGVRHIWRTDGVKGFYRGAAVSLMGVSHGAVQFAVYDPLKKLWKRHLISNSLGSEGEEVKMGTAATLGLSSSAKIVAGAVTYPYQVLRSRLQTYDAEKRFGRGIRGVATRMWREDGWRGFYRGLATNIVRVLPATWVTFLVYENARFYLTRWDREEVDR
ncbi:mitochondrial carrier domain-containing protein [Calycina marina]|uniref:Mitochondrial carrier domain-containing protein n=1 Tax=Calycina marina TaxID=1763456 RepID=A0A9P8CHA3_9HELO|nr:mitochondrial carrier domain-containing protein [Calycina marina]